MRPVPGNNDDGDRDRRDSHDQATTAWPAILALADYVVHTAPPRIPSLPRTIRGYRFALAVVLAIRGFLALVGVETRWVTRRTYQTAEDIYPEHADPARKPTVRASSAAMHGSTVATPPGSTPPSAASLRDARQADVEPTSGSRR